MHCPVTLHRDRVAESVKGVSISTLGMLGVTATVRRAENTKSKRLNGFRRHWCISLIAYSSASGKRRRRRNKRKVKVDVARYDLQCFCAYNLHNMLYFWTWHDTVPCEQLARHHKAHALLRTPAVFAGDHGHQRRVQGLPCKTRGQHLGMCDGPVSRVLAAIC